MFSIVARRASAAPPTGCSSRDGVAELAMKSRACKHVNSHSERSHRQYKNPNKPGTVTVAGKPSLEAPPGTLNAILRQAGLKKAGSGE